MLKPIYITLFLLFFSSVSNAGLYLDPYAGYILTGSADSTGSSEDVSGFQVGSRVGWASKGFFYGAEYQFGEIDAGNTADHTQFGGFFGYNFPVLVRAWLTYIIETEVEFNGGTQDGSGFKLGVGYTGYPFISINLDHSITNVSGTVSNTSVDTDVTITMISVSLPLEF